MHLLNKLMENLLVTPVPKVLGGFDKLLGGDSVKKTKNKPRLLLFKSMNF